VSSTPCWKCNADQLVIAIAGSHVRSADPYAKESKLPILLSNIKAMPKKIADHLAAFHPPFQKRHSKTTQSVYYANTCDKCDANFGDFFLFCEPEGAFWPIDEEQARAINIMGLPFAGEFDFVCECHTNSELIFAHAERVDFA
jgi:hypothetical protein